MSAISSGDWLIRCVSLLLMSRVEHVERTCGCAQVLLGEVQIDRGLFKISMAEQDLDGAEICSCFKQMSREAVSQGMRMDVLMLQPRAERSAWRRYPEHLG